jgi:hypothetical protein
MAEYLAPGVYVEEIPSGNKPIQAASTSTSAMVGMTERGPVNTPTLVTSGGAYARLFGGTLNPLAFLNGLDALPYAAEGFFGNGGSRLYVVRVVGANATESELRLTADTGTPADRMTVMAQAALGQATVLLSNAATLAAADTLLISDGTASEFVTVDVAALQPRLTIAGGLTNSYLATENVTLMTPTAVAVLTAASAEGATQIAVDDGTTVAVGATVLIGTGNTAELAEIAAIVVNDVTLTEPLQHAHANATAIHTLAASVTVAPLAAPANASGATVHLEADPTGMSSGDVLLIGPNAVPESELVILSSISQLATLTANLVNTHAAGVAVVPAAEVMTVHATSPGVWGNTLRVQSQPAAQVETATSAVSGAGTNTLTLETAFGLYPGSVIMIGTVRAEVSAVNTNSGVVTLTANLGAEVAIGTDVASQEFSLLVERLDSAGRAAESEFFENLSLASEHPRYALKVVGAWDVPADRPGASGASALIRLSDQANATTRILPLVHGVARRLAGGNDDVAGVTEDSFVGVSADDPGARTGIQALENEPTISLVSVPGQTSVNVQKQLLNHCEKMRYRFAVLDTPLGSNLQAARSHRQNFDSTRAALYYPGLQITDRYGEKGDRRVIAPSGHMLGVIARTDVTRGVHKAPANEVVRGILGFETALTKGEQDILNPINLNCFRDFRSENRGLRVYGARVATSDPEWKYINVRRLLLFIEQSLDTGLQWAVFEPNDKPLWDTVKQSITNFLTTVWRSGALEGQTQPEAFFVNIGYNVTMTQDDIDNGRMIVEVAVAPVKPSEFVIVRISQKTREAVA